MRGENLLLTFRASSKNIARRQISSTSSSVSNDTVTDKVANTSSGLYPGVPLFDLIRGWTLYNLFRSDYIVDNSVKVG